MLVLVSGLSAGCVHVVSGPDHLAALAPLAFDAPGRAAGLGFRWGLGHGLGAAALGLVGVAARQAFDLEAISGVAELLVGFVLIGVGVWTWRRTHFPSVPHDHGGKTFAVGMLHGVAGTGHVLAVLPSLALPTGAALVYLAAYLVAAVGVMTAFGAGLGRVVAHVDPSRVHQLTRITAALAVAVGVVWIGLAWPG